MGLKLYDLALDQGTVMIRHGKGNKDRVVPIGDRALAWIDKYLIEVRPTLATEPDDGTVFLTNDGEALSPNRLSDLAHQYVKQANLGKPGSCHLFRHACATHMLERGADIRIIQALLGHDDLATTAIYTRVAIGHLKAVHTRTHPARLTRQPDVRTGDETEARRALLTALAAEAEDGADA